MRWSVRADPTLAACNRVVNPCSKRAFAHWWATTAADRFTKISAALLDHRRFWDAMHAVTDTKLAEIAHRLALRMIKLFEVDTSALALDMTNFATYIDTTNAKAPIAARGKAKQKRTDLRLIGLGLVVTRDGGVSLVSHAYPGNRPDVTQFATMIDQLCTRHAAVPADRGGPSEVTVVFNAGQNSVANSFRQLKDPHLVSFSPMHHPTDHNIRVHTFTCVLDDLFQGVEVCVS
jgi:transposase